MKSYKAASQECAALPQWGRYYDQAPIKDTGQREGWKGTVPQIG